MVATTDEAPRAVARARYMPLTARKVRRVTDLVRGKKVDQALAILQFAPQAAARPVSKVVASAAANAENNQDLDPSTLWVSRIYVDDAPRRGRALRYRAQGRAHLLKKRASHITVEVESRPAERAASRTRRPSAKGSAR